MLKKNIPNFSKNKKILAIIFLFIISILASSYFNHQKDLNKQKYNSFVNNIYLNKTLDEIKKI